MVRFDFQFGAISYQCGHWVSGNMISAVVGDMETVGDLDGIQPERVARILVHELLVQRSFAARRPNLPTGTESPIEEGRARIGK
jgi:hypothetical protein